MALSMFIGNSCKKLINFEFESHVDDENILKIINSPICKFGIKDKIFNVLGIPATLPENLISLASNNVQNRRQLKGLSKKLMYKNDNVDDLDLYALQFGS